MGIVIAICSAFLLGILAAHRAVVWAGDHGFISLDRLAVWVERSRQREQAELVHTFVPAAKRRKIGQ